MAKPKSGRSPSVTEHGLSFKRYHLPIVILVALLILFLRRPDALLHAQFWAEDGSVWFKYAHEHQFSILSLVQPYAGYLQVFPRAIACFGGLFNMAQVPFFFNSIALVIQIVPLLILWGQRFSQLVPNAWLRLYISAAYLLLPYTAEVHGNLTNSQWFLAIIGFMILFLPSAVRSWQRFLERGTLALIGLSGPFSLLLAPVVVADKLLYKKPPLISKDKAVIILICASIQSLMIIFAPQEARIRGALGVDTTLFSNIVGGQVFGAGLFGSRTLSGFTDPAWIAGTFTIIGLAVMVFAWVKGPRLLRAFITYASLILAATLMLPNGPTPGMTWWQALAMPQTGGRYYFLPHLAVFIALGWLLVCYKNRLFKVLAGGLIAVSAVTGIRTDFVHPPYKDYRYGDFVKKYQAAEPGETVYTQLNPGGPSEIKLKKRAD